MKIKHFAKSPLLETLVKCLFLLQYEHILRILIKRGGTSVRVGLIKSMERNSVLDMMYVAKDGSISKRRIKVIQVDDVSFRAYCYLRKSNRTFEIDNILALVPVTSRERIVV